KEVSKEDLNIDLVRNVAYIAYLKRQPSDSIDLYQMLLKIKPEDETLQHDYGYPLSQVHQDEAIKLYKKLMQNFPGNPSHEYYLGITYIRLRNYEEAFAHLMNAIKAGFKEKEMFNSGKMSSLPKVYIQQLVTEYNNMHPNEKQYYVNYSPSAQVSGQGRP
ncbi:MAG: tetratricopeptide repeat protein, partial [Desulfobaccales bacterium]